MNSAGHEDCWKDSRTGSMSLLAGTLDHGVRSNREVSESHGSLSISGTPQYSPELPGSGFHGDQVELRQV